MKKADGWLHRPCAFPKVGKLDAWEIKAHAEEACTKHADEGEHGGFRDNGIFKTCD